MQVMAPSNVADTVSELCRDITGLGECGAAREAAKECARGGARGPVRGAARASAAGVASSLKRNSCAASKP